MAASVKNSLILLKLEAVPGVDAAPTPGADAVAMQVDDFSAEIEERSATNEVVGTGYGAQDELPYARRLRTSFKVPLAAPAALAAPAWAALLRSCAVAEAVAASTVTYTPASTALKSASVYAYVAGQVRAGVYGAGDLTVAFKVGEVPTIQVDHTALVAQVASQAVPQASLAAWTRPLAFGPASCAGVVLGGALTGGVITGGAVYPLRELTLKAGNDVVDLELAGPESIGIYDWAPTLTLTADIAPAALTALHAAMHAGTTTSVGLKHGAASGGQITLFVPMAAITAIESMREGKLFLTQLTLACQPTGAGNDAWQLVLSQQGGTPPAQDPQPYTLADIEPYRVSGTIGQIKNSVFVVPYNVEGGVPRSWSEPALGGAASTRMTIRTPNFDAPPEGYAVCAGAHPTTMSNYEYWVEPGRPARAFVDGWMVDVGVWVNIDSAHPQVTTPELAPGTPAPFWDLAYAVQMIRALHQALNLNRSAVVGLGRSRGSLLMLQVLTADRADPNATTYEGRQSSQLRAVAIMQGQLLFSAADDPVTGEPGFARKAIVPADYNAAVAANPDDPRIFAQPSIYTAAKSTQTSALIMYEHEYTWLNRLVTLAEYNNTGVVADKVHYQDAGLWLLEAMTVAGKASQCAINTNVGPGDANTYLKYLAWFKSILTVPAAITRPVTAVEHAAIVQAAADGCNLYYLPSDATGCAVNADGTGTVAPGTKVAGIVDWSKGLSNAVNVPYASQADLAGMPNTTPQPSAVAVNGNQMALVCGVNKYLQVGRSSTTSASVLGAMPGGTWGSVMRNRAPGNYRFNPDNVTAGVVVATVDAAVPVTAERAAKRLASQIMGESYPIV
ncbi:MAG: hypothetical protein LCH73_02990 [Proteobacteria bacterium]|nr:hypothetical protein [Pseudomonadota bacterium]